MSQYAEISIYLHILHVIMNNSTYFAEYHYTWVYEHYCRIKYVSYYKYSSLHTNFPMEASISHSLLRVRSSKS